MNSIGRFTLALLLLLVGVLTFECPNMLDLRCKLSNHEVVISSDSIRSLGDSSDPGSKGVSSTDDLLVADESSSLDIN